MPLSLLRILWHCVDPCSLLFVSLYLQPENFMFGGVERIPADNCNVGGTSCLVRFPASRAPVVLAARPRSPSLLQRVRSVGAWPALSSLRVLRSDSCCVRSRLASPDLT
jgi:hypothetical protein